MKKRGMWIVLLVVVIAGAALGVTLAFFTDSKEQTNVFTMGNVTISLSEPEFSLQTDGTMKLENVTPNQKIVKDPTITVDKNSSDAYIRAEIRYGNMTKEQSEQLEENIEFSEGWIKGDDGYMYYREKVTKGNVVNIFKSVRIPSSWGAEMASKEFNISVTAEAIQADNFTPITKEIAGITYITNWLDSDQNPINMN